jgi:hypothetical protein
MDFVSVLQTLAGALVALAATVVVLEVGFFWLLRGEDVT